MSNAKNEKIQVTVASLGEVKVEATVLATRRLGLAAEVRRADSRSGVPEQPYGDLQTLLGAYNRAKSLAHAADAGSYVVALENGICSRRDDFADLAYAVVVAPSGRVTVRSSREVAVPPELVRQSASVGWATTAGKLEASRTPGCDHADPHVVWSGGRETRLGILTDLVQEALRAALRGERRDLTMLSISPGVAAPRAERAGAQAPSSVHVSIAGVARELAVREVAPGVHLGILLLACDPELTEAAGRALAAHVPPGAVLVAPDGKSQSLLHVVQRETGGLAVLVSKRRKSYLVEPVLEVAARSITTATPQTFYLGDDDRARLDGQDAVIVDDVVSTGGTVDALRLLLSRCGVRRVYVLAVATEGDPRPDVVSLVHLQAFRTREPDRG